MFMASYLTSHALANSLEDWADLANCISFPALSGAWKKRMKNIECLCQLFTLIYFQNLISMSTDCCFMLLLINYSIVSYLDVLAGIGILDSQTQYTRNNSQIVAMLLLCCIHYWLWERQTET